MIFEYFDDVGVLPVIDRNNTGPGPSDADYLEAQRLDAALADRDPHVELVLVNGGVRVIWL